MLVEERGVALMRRILILAASVAMIAAVAWFPWSSFSIRADFTVFNREKKAREFVFSYEIPDIGNGGFITAEDRKSLGFSFGRVTLKPGERKTMSVFVTVPRNHCSSILFVVSARSGGEKGSISLYLCQYDSENDMNERARPAKYGNYPTLARNKTKVGRVFRLFGSIFVVYSNRFIFCYDEKTQSLRWFVESEEFHDIGIFEQWIYTDGFCVETKTGKNRGKGRFVVGSYYYHNYRHIYEGKVFLVFQDQLHENAGSIRSVACMDQANGKGYWITPSYEWFWGFSTSFTMPRVPGKIFYNMRPWEFLCNELACLDANTGKYLFRIGPSGRYIQKHDQSLLIATSATGIDRGNEHIDIWDCKTNKAIYHHEALGEIRLSDYGRILCFADYKSAGAYDLASRRLLWKNPGDGAILADPLIDPLGKFVYMLDEDSVWKKKNYHGYEQAKLPSRLRLFKMEADTGRIVWKTNLYTLPKGDEGFWPLENKLEFSNGAILASIDVGYGNEMKPKLVFRVKPTDGGFTR